MGGYMTEFVRGTIRSFKEYWRLLLKAFNYLYDFLPVIIKYVSNEHWRLLLISIIYILGSIYLVLILKAIVSKIIRCRRIQTHFSDFFMFCQQCSCSYIEFEIYKKYGYIAYFIIVIASKAISLLLNGKTSNVLLVYEEYRMDNISPIDFTIFLCSHSISCIFCALFTKVSLAVPNKFIGTSFRFTQCYLPDIYQRLPFICLTEFAGSFILRFVMIKIDNDRFPKRIWAVPAVQAISFTSTLFFTGSPGLDFFIDFSRLMDCIEKKHIFMAVWFMIGYAFPIFLGWYLSSCVKSKPTTLKSPWGAMTEADRRANGNEEIREAPGIERFAIPRLNEGGERFNYRRRRRR